MSTPAVQNSLSSQPLHGGADHVLNMISYGVPFQLAAEDPEMLDRMRAYAPFGSTACPSAPASARNFAVRGSHNAGWQVVADDQIVADSELMTTALSELNGHLTIYVAEHAPDFVFVHAGVVACNGRALLLPGVSHAGKSTLVAELVRAGATYYSDEFALLDSQGNVHAFPRDLRMRRPGLREQTSVPLSQFRGRAGVEPLTAGMVVFAEYVEEAHWDPQPLSLGTAVLETLLHTVPVQRTPARAMAAVSAMMQHATAWKSLRGEAAATAQSLLATLAAGEAPA